MGDFNFPDTNWECHIVYTDRFRKFLKHAEDNVLVQILGGPTRKGALLNFFFVNREELMGNVVIRDCLGQ